MFDGICEALHREMDILEEKYANGKIQMNLQDLEHIDKIAHTLKSIAGYEAMKGSSELGDYRGRGRSYRSMGREDYYRDVPEGYNRSERRY